MAERQLIEPIETTWVDFLPLLGILSAMIWVHIVYQRCLHRLRQVYTLAGISPQPVTSQVNAWSVFQPAPGDTIQIIEEKAKIVADHQRMLRYCIPITIGSLVALLVLSTALKKTLYFYRLTA